jgi:hypothetical protein
MIGPIPTGGSQQAPLLPGTRLGSGTFRAFTPTNTNFNSTATATATLPGVRTLSDLQSESRGGTVSVVVPDLGSPASGAATPKSFAIPDGIPNAGLVAIAVAVLLLWSLSQ